MEADISKTVVVDCGLNNTHFPSTFCSCWIYVLTALMVEGEGPI